MSRRGLPLMSESLSLFAVSLVESLSLTETVPESAPVNRMKRLLPQLFASGDDDGVVKVGIIRR